MLKKIVNASLSGAAFGIIGVYLWTVVISLFISDGSIYYDCVPALVEMTGSEPLAVLLQIGMSALVGGGFAAAGFIWKIEHWSLTKQTVVNYIITCAIYFPCAYVVGWMQRSFTGALIYYGIYTAIFVIIWFIFYFVNRAKVRKMNEALSKNNL